MRVFRRYLASLAALVLLIALPLGLVLASPSNKWRIQVSSDADSDGVVVMQLSPVGGTPVSVSVAIPDDTGENHVARLIRDGLRQQLGEHYHVEVDDGEDVLVKKRSGGATFEIEILQQIVKGLRISLDGE